MRRTLDQTFAETERGAATNPDDPLAFHRLLIQTLRESPDRRLEQMIAFCREQRFCPFLVIRAHLRSRRLEFLGPRRDYRPHFSDFDDRLDLPIRPRWLTWTMDSAIERGPRRRIGRKRAISESGLTEHILTIYESAILEENSATSEIHGDDECLAWAVQAFIAMGGKQR